MASRRETRLRPAAALRPAGRHAPVPRRADAGDDGDEDGAQEAADEAEGDAEEEIGGDEAQDAVVGLGEEREGVFQPGHFVDEGGAEGAKEGAGEVAHHVVGGRHLRSSVWVWGLLGFG